MKDIDSILLSPTGDILEITETPWQQTYTDDTMKVIHIMDSGKSPDLYMRYCGMSACEPGHSFGPAMRDHYVIHYIFRGTGTLQIGENEYRLGAGQGFLLCPNVVSHYKADLEDPWEYAWVGFHGLNASTYLSQAGLDADHAVFTYERGDTLKNCLVDMVNAYDTYKYGTNLKLQSLLYLLLSELIEDASEKSPGSRLPVQHRYIQKAVSYIQMNYMQEDLTVSFLADYVGLDRSYLCALFKKYLSTSPQNYISRYRINRACELLEQTSYPIGEIAHMIGYKDPVVFQKFFKNITGVSPRGYRKEALH
ncbi:MAG: AraC family transcriptional regulator [Lachnospiraceae bacterium]|nr:AraC family transcriptional regulator [Lachnospiraceae bacterium]